MRNISKIVMSVSALMVVASMLLCISACNDDTPEDTSADSATTESTAAQTEARVETELNYDDVDVASYISKVTYKELDITLESANASKEEALWKAILESAQISSYPEDKVDYFFKQTKEAYMYLVNGNEEDYQLLLKNRGTNENKMREEARELVKKDLVYYYIVRAEKISVTEQEKTQLFEKYVDKYVTTYGYNRDYVKGNMAEIIYDSMLYDKTMEYLIKNNTFSVDTQTTDTQGKTEGQT